MHHVNASDMPFHLNSIQRALHNVRRRYSDRIPFGRNALLVPALLWITYYLLFTNSIERSAYYWWPFFLMLAKMAFFILLLLSFISIVSTVLQYLRLKQRIRRGLMQATIAIKSHPPKTFLQAYISPAQKPVLGRVWCSIYFSNEDFSPIELPLLYPQSWLPTSSLTNEVELKELHIQAYYTEQSTIHFYDWLGIIKLSLALPYRQSILRLPQTAARTTEVSMPLSTNHPEVRIKDMRKAEGDWTHYKDFEAGDDVRRIAWKVYARHKELVVRIPEIFEPYASHLHLFASFYCPEEWIAYPHFNARFLDLYKEEIWSIYQHLQQQYAIKWISDQEVKLPEHLQEIDGIAHALTHSNWQTSRPPADHLPHHASLLVFVSSLCPVEQIKAIYKQRGNKVMIIVLHQSEALNYPIIWRSFQHLFRKPEDIDDEQLKLQWRLSAYRKKIIQNEAKQKAMQAEQFNH